MRTLAGYVTSDPARLSLLDLAKAVEQGSDLDAALQSAARKHYGKAAA